MKWLLRYLLSITVITSLTSSILAEQSQGQNGAVPALSDVVRLDSLSHVAASPKIHYGFPRMVRAGNGDFLLFYRIGTTHAYDDSRIAMRRSIDNGATWSAERILWKAKPGFSAHNPVALVTPRGKVILWVSSYRYSSKPRARTPGYWSHSNDNGKTWSPFVRFDNDPSRSVYYVNEAIVTSDGLLAAADVHEPSGVGPCRTLLFHSTDDGRTWSVRSRLTKPGKTEGDEVALLETEPNKLLCILRDRRSKDTYRYWSHDGGRTWSERESIKKMLGCTLQRPFLLQLNKDTILLSGRDYDQKQVILYRSRDGGRSFSNRQVLEQYKKDGAYTSIVRLSDSTARIVWYSDAGTPAKKPDIKSARLIYGKIKDSDSTQHRMNVLFLVVDDLRPRLGCYGESDVKSPNIDRLASQGVVFRNAFCQVASCNPSRCSLLTSRRPDTTTVYGNKKHFRSVLPGVVTLPQQFKYHGYYTHSLGKVFHGTFRNDKHQDQPSWSVPEWRPDSLLYASPKGIEVVKQRYPHVFKPGRSPKEILAQRRYKGLVWEAPDVDDSVLSDGRLADKAIEVLQKVQDRPFFLAVGFVKPHAPYVAPKKYFDLYKLEDIKLPKNNQLPRDGVSLAHDNSKEVRGYTGVPKSGPIAEKTQREIALAYNACVSYVDAQIGRVLAELDRLGLRDNTVVVLWGDHGYHVGHNGLWGKNTNFDASARVPLIVSVPGSNVADKSTDALIELVDVYPTLCEVCNLPLTVGLQGTSFAPLLENPDRSWKKAAFTQHPRPLYDKKASMGHSMRTNRYRLTEWAGPRLAKPVYELYDYQKDPGETVNLANRPEYRELLKELTKQLHAGWKAAQPTTNRP